MKYRLIFTILSVILWMGCYEEDHLTPTEEGELKYTVPQGNHDYDQKIVDWNKRCGFYILYKYEPKDIYWNMNEWKEAVYDSISKYPFGSFKAELPEEDFVGKQLDLLERGFLNFYPDTLLRRCMPMKLLLGKNLQYSSYDRLGDMDVTIGFDNIVLSHGDETIETLTGRKRELIKDSINILFLERLVDKQKIVISSQFTEVSSSYYGQVVPTDQMYENGFIVEDRWGKRTKEQDWKNYLRTIVKTPYSVLTEEPGDGDYTTRGILHEKKDTQGVIRKKYDILINYFKKEYGLEIQSIGNARGV